MRSSATSSSDGTRRRPNRRRSRKSKEKEKEGRDDRGGRGRRRESNGERPAESRGNDGSGAPAGASSGAPEAQRRPEPRGRLSSVAAEEPSAPKPSSRSRQIGAASPGGGAGVTAYRDCARVFRRVRFPSQPKENRMARFFRRRRYCRFNRRGGEGDRLQGSQHPQGLRVGNREDSSEPDHGDERAIPASARASRQACALSGTASLYRPASLTQGEPRARTPAFRHAKAATTRSEYRRCRC